MKPVTARVAALSVEAKEAINVAPAIAARHDDDDRETVSDTADATKCPGGSKASRPWSIRRAGQKASSKKKLMLKTASSRHQPRGGEEKAGSTAATQTGLKEQKRGPTHCPTNNCRAIVFSGQNDGYLTTALAREQRLVLLKLHGTGRLCIS